MIREAGVIATAALVWLLAPATTAAATLAAEVRLDPTAPAAGSSVIGVREVGGQASAPEGVLRVVLYVVPAGAPLDLAVHRPVVGTEGPAVGAPLAFTLRWHSAVHRALGLVDLHVVAETALRRVGTFVPDVRVIGTAAVRWSGPRQRTGHRGAAVIRRPSAPGPRGPSAAGVYVGGFDESLPYAVSTSRSAALAPRVRAVAVAAERAATGWASVAAGLALIVLCAHAHLLLRPSGPADHTEGTS